jgi:exopolyphosphatase/pppGpp-phosphohydrolase
MMGKDSLWPVWRSGLPAGAELEQAAMEKLRSWASSLDPDIEHSARVTRFALQLYDELCACGVLSRDNELRRILEAAAILHEVGRSKTIDENGGHQKRGFKAVAKLTPPLGWNNADIQSVAVAIRYQRGALPVTTNSSFVGLTAKRRKDLLPVIGVLRLANALDDAHDESISTIKIECQQDAVVIYAEGLRQLSKNAEQIARSRYLLETISRHPIVVRPMPARKNAPALAPHSRRRVAGETFLNSRVD